jgi:predicted dithiol-disulfide oxidoreductase (DUF899 family)
VRPQSGGAGQARAQDRNPRGLELPWVAIEKDYQLDTEDGKRGLADLFDGRSQLLVPEVKALIVDPPPELSEWSEQIRADFRAGLLEVPAWIVFARENGTIYHTYTVTAPDHFVAPYHAFLLERTPKQSPSAARTWRKDEYPD